MPARRSVPAGASLAGFIRFVMLIVCPSCASEYTLDPTRLGPKGREVRCASCRTAWFAKPAPARGGARKKAGPKTRRGPRSPARPGLWRDRAAVAALVILLVGAPASIAMRQRTVQLLPGTAGLFAAIGMPVNLVGLRLEGIESGLVEENGAKVLLVEGALVPAAGRDVAVPRLAYAIEAEDGKVLYDWTTRPPVERVSPGETVRFTARLPSPPADGKRVVVSFAPPRSGHDVASR